MKKPTYLQMKKTTYLKMGIPLLIPKPLSLVTNTYLKEYNLPVFRTAYLKNLSFLAKQRHHPAPISHCLSQLRPLLKYKTDPILQLSLILLSDIQIVNGNHQISCSTQRWVTLLFQLRRLFFMV